MGVVLTAQNCAGRLGFATEHQNWQIRHWRPVLFADESKFTLSTCDRRDRVWRCRGERSDCNILQHDRFGSGSVRISASGKWPPRSPSAHARHPVAIFLKPRKARTLHLRTRSLRKMTASTDKPLNSADHALFLQLRSAFGTCACEKHYATNGKISKMWGRNSADTPGAYLQHSEVSNCIPRGPQTMRVFKISLALHKVLKSFSAGRILDLKTGTVKKEGQQSSMRMCMGSRRSFICRMRCGNAPLDHLPLSRITTMRKRYRNGLGPVKEGEAQYSVVHCTGYIKAWPPAGPVMTLRSHDRDVMAGPCRIPSLPPEPAACMDRLPERRDERGKAPELYEAPKGTTWDNISAMAFPHLKICCDSAEAKFAANGGRFRCKLCYRNATGCAIYISTAQ
ncbi:unnamed protein product [Ranitomeya imitator]|uniref:Uncharacterized protein n=1 Tax=Ranitomeya imitator TaxID=111125 RepID=A0ABN9LFH4_9NEOB|nr:unnamed protein product [Ranitomeya imitator]